MISINRLGRRTFAKRKPNKKTSVFPLMAKLAPHYMLGLGAISFYPEYTMFILPVPVITSFLHARWEMGYVQKATTQRELANKNQDEVFMKAFQMLKTELVTNGKLAEHFEQKNIVADSKHLIFSNLEFEDVSAPYKYQLKE